MAYGFNEARTEFKAEFAGASDRLLSMVAAGAIAYMAGAHGWNEGQKIAVADVRDALMADALTGGNKKSNAYRLTAIAFRVAVVVNKSHKQLRDTLKAAETCGEAVALLKAEFKANLDAAGAAHTIDNVAALYAKAKKEKKTAAPVDRICAAIEKAADSDALSLADCDAIIEAVMRARQALMGAEQQSLAA